MVGGVIRGEIGLGAIALALIPTVNIVVIGAVYKLTGKVKSELVGEVTGAVSGAVSEEVGNAKNEIQTDLKNGIRDRLDRVERKLETMHKENQILREKDALG